ncbi:MAG TPA: serine O-acetyltransferase [Candidatus Dietzia intestinipullorum]|nr:serine O-acetyltransferase [Candidatus Dietzia intestinipullorum]
MTTELSIANPCVPQTEDDSSVRAVWDRLSADARSSRDEPLIAGLVLDLIDGCDDLGESLARLAASRIATPEIGRHVLEKEIRAVLTANPRVLDAVADDLVVSYERNPAYPNYLVPYLFAKGFLGLQMHRVAHEMWKAGRVMAASFLQSRNSEVFAMDIHPAARVGSGILVDHATGIVVGETCVIGDGVSILQGVTLGGTGNEDGDRHPKIGAGVLLSAGAIVLGNVRVGDCSRVAAGSVVLDEVPPHTTVAGVPAKVVRRHADSLVPAERMDQEINSGS